MFEKMTFENILDDMLSRVNTDVDKREGSIIYDALAPSAYHLAQVYFNLNNFIDLVSGDTAVGEYLDRVVRDYGITRKHATSAERKITTDKPIPLGARLAIEDLTFTITKKITDYEYIVTCEQTGAIGNAYNGTMQNIDNVDAVATLTDIIVSGVDEETDDNLRNRFYAYLQRPSTSGNAYNYRDWALSVPGVGDAKVFPLWNGNGTVKVVIINSDMEIDETLEPIVYKYIESVKPIGAMVAVDSPGERAISIRAKIFLDGTVAYNQVYENFTSMIVDYFKSLIFDTYSVSYAKIGSILLSVPGVADYNDLIIDNSTVNVEIGEMEMPIVGEIILEVV